MPILTDDIQKRPARDKNYWGGFAAGAAIGTGAAVAAVLIANMTGKKDSRVVRLEDSVQIGRHVEDVFRAWMDLESLPEYMEYVNSVRKYGNVSHWDVTVDGKDFKWKAETTQLVPNESIGWKSLSGPKHTGRITFAPLGEDTLVHVTMNYVPANGLFSRFVSPFADHLESYINQSLREFKASLEGHAGEKTTTHPEKADWRDSIDRMKKTAVGVNSRLDTEHTGS
jgi:uncharacterized membrane protein